MSAKQAEQGKEMLRRWQAMHAATSAVLLSYCVWAVQVSEVASLAAGSADVNGDVP